MAPSVWLVYSIILNLRGKPARQQRRAGGRTSVLKLLDAPHYTFRHCLRSRRDGSSHGYNDHT